MGYSRCARVCSSCTSMRVITCCWSATHATIRAPCAHRFLSFSRQPLEPALTQPRRRTCKPPILIAASPGLPLARKSGGRRGGGHEDEASQTARGDRHAVAIPSRGGDTQAGASSPARARGAPSVWTNAESDPPVLVAYRSCSHYNAPTRCVQRAMRACARSSRRRCRGTASSASCGARSTSSRRRRREIATPSRP